ncbi:hypothetical protein EU528_14105 [Candidatus Thorarchaeota archaeon]|nr:MAG: hypothetical protein EU528_14105 [Candidatus Thorarchaeota archaeon]
MEGLNLTRKWFAIAKTEFFVQTSKLRRVRKVASLLLLVFGIIWALFIVPNIMESVLSDLEGTGIDVLLMVSFPSLMRSVMLFLWILLLIYPISYALQEIRIGQWEIMLSNNVSTWDMMFGMFMGKIPIYGLFVLYATPVILTPFTIFFRVSIFGQIIMYFTVFFVALSTLFLSNLITTGIQAKLGESSRGNDIAKALSMVVALALLLPMYGLMFFSDSMSAILGFDIFILFPFTWAADIISWSVIIFNEIGVSATLFIDILKITALGDLVLILCFTIAIIIIAYISADRIFSFGAGPRTEKITTIGEENRFLKGIKRVYTGPPGVLMVNSIKEFTRKMQNVSRLIYGVIIAILLPVIMNYAMGSVPEGAPPEAQPFIVMLVIIMIGMMLAMISGVTFGGIGFLESKDQLWIIKSTPNGVWKFAKARIFGSFILIIPMAIIPSIVAAIIFGFTILDALMIIVYTYWSTCGAVLLCAGVTANNPAYEDQKSSAFILNTMVSLFTLLGILIISLMIGFEVMAINANLLLFMLILSTPMIVIGAIVYVIGIVRMSRPDTK